MTGGDLDNERNGQANSLGIIQSNCSPLTYGSFTYGCYDQQPRLTVDSVLTKLSAEDLVQLLKSIPGELAKRVEQLERRAEEAQRVLELARAAVGVEKP